MTAHAPATALHATPTGSYWLPSGITTDVVVNAIREGLVYDEEIVEAAKWFVEPGTTVLDLGACFGQMTVLFARMVGEQGHVVAFEASPDLCGLLRRNVAENGVAARVDVREAAVWSAGGEVLSYPFPDWSVFGSYGSFGVDPGARAAGWQVGTVAIDDLELPSRVSFMKVDVQGSDLAALQGAERTIRRERMPIVFEYEELLRDRFGADLGDYLSFVERIGYRVEQVIGGCNYLIVPA
jgi:FkbM family methyltransferase